MDNPGGSQMLHPLLAAGDVLSGAVRDTLAVPLLNACMFLIPAGVAMAGVHKLLSHQESGANFLVDILIKGGGAILLIQVAKQMAGLP